MTGMLVSHQETVLYVLMGVQATLRLFSLTHKMPSCTAELQITEVSQSVLTATLKLLLQYLLGKVLTTPVNQSM